MHELRVDKIKTRRIEITDSENRTVIQIGCDKDDAPLIRLMDGTGKPRAVMGLQNGKPRFGLIGDDGQVRLYLILRGNGPGIEFMDELGKRRLLMFLASEEGQNPDLFFIDANETIKFGLVSTDDGTVKVMSQDKDGQAVERSGMRPI